MIVALDSNVLAYFCEVARVPADDAKIAAVQVFLGRLGGQCQLVVPVQALGELYNLLLKSGSTREDALDRTTAIDMQFGVVDTGSGVMREALGLAVQHKLQIWDAVMISAARDAGCTILLSEDMQDGFKWRGTEVLNPLSERAEHLLFG